MEEQKEWISELEKSIIEEDDKILFNEASDCFLSKNYRASYIMSWISIIESLKRKIKLFSNLGDKRATESLEKIDDFEKAKQSTDKLIYEEANKCGILDNAALSTINYLWEQRCLFAHPYNKQPEEDEVKHIIGQSIRLVLGKELLYNKDYLTELSENIANKPFFLPTETDEIREFAKRTIARTPSDLHPFFFKTFLYKVGLLSKNESKFSELKKLRYYLIELFVNTDIPLDKNEWSLENRVTNFPFECYIGFIHQETWSKLPDRIKEMLISYLENENNNEKLIALKSITAKLVEFKVLEESFVNRYYKKLDNIGFNSSINFYGLPKKKFERIKNELESYQYDQQNVVIDYLRKPDAIDFIKGLDVEKQFYLGRLIKSSALNGHWKSQTLSSNLVDNSIGMTDEVRAGSAYGSFVSLSDKYHFDEKHIINSLKILNQLSEILQNKVYDLANKLFDENPPDDWDIMIFNEAQFSTLVKNVIDGIPDWNPNNKVRFESFTEKIKNYFAQQRI